MPDLQRVVSEYYYVREETPYSAHDAIAVAILSARPKQRPFVQAYLDTAWKALADVLELPRADESAAALAGNVLSPLFERFEPFIFGNLLSVRRATLNFVRIHAGILEGDPWGGPMVRESLRPPLEAAREWYDRTSNQILEGLIPVDRAICAMLGWNPDREEPFSKLRERGWRQPTDDEIFEHWID